MHSSNRAQTKDMASALKKTTSNFLWTHPGHRNGRSTGLLKRPNAAPFKAVGQLALRAGLFVKTLATHPVAVLSMVIAMALSLACLTGYAVMDAAITDLTLNIDGNTTQIRTTQRTVGELLSSVGVTLDPFDSLDPAANAVVTDGTEICIRRAMTVWINDGGQKSVSVKIVSGTVQDALEQAGITLNEQDRLSIEPATMLTEGMDIGIVRVTTQTVSAQEEVPYNIVVRKSSDVDKGDYKVVSEGKTGLIEKQVMQVMENGKIVSSYLVEESVLSSAQDRVVHEGTYVAPTPTPKPAAAPVKVAAKASSKSTTTSRTSTSKSSSASKEVVKASTTTSGGTLTVNGKSVSYSKVYNGKATAYTHTGNATASGVMPVAGTTVAVDPKVFPLGTRLYIPGYGFAIAQDTGDKVIKNYTVDLFMDTKDECINWGIRSVKIYVLD